MASYYYSFKRYDQAAKTMAKIIDPAKDDPEAYMRVGRTYYSGGNYKTADSVFNIIIKKDPNYLPAHLFIARTYSRMDPDYKLGLAKSKFEKLNSVAKMDSVKNESEMGEALEYLGYYHMNKSEFSTAKSYYSRLISLNPNSKENQIKGYNGLGQVELKLANNEKTNEGRLPFLARAADAYNKILALDPSNASAKEWISYIREFEASVKKGINPNEIKGVVKDAATGAPIAYASVRVKDTAAESSTNTKGEFKFEIPQGMETLVISAKGYQTKEVPITKSRVYPVSLEK
jgi:tetratricopeptide (TPR) repeat protein